MMFSLIGIYQGGCPSWFTGMHLLNGTFSFNEEYVFSKGMTAEEKTNGFTTRKHFLQKELSNLLLKNLLIAERGFDYPLNEWCFHGVNDYLESHHRIDNQYLTHLLKIFGLTGDYYIPRALFVVACFLAWYDENINSFDKFICKTWWRAGQSNSEGNDGLFNNISIQHKSLKSISKVSIGIQYSGLLCELSGNYIEVIIEENSFRIERDKFGAIPLYYSPKEKLISTCLQHFNLPKETLSNEDIHKYISCSILTMRSTGYKDIYRLMPFETLNTMAVTCI